MRYLAFFLLLVIGCSDNSTEPWYEVPTGEIMQGEWRIFRAENPYAGRYVARIIDGRYEYYIGPQWITVDTDVKLTGDLTISYSREVLGDWIDVTISLTPGTIPDIWGGGNGYGGEWVRSINGDVDERYKVFAARH